MAFNPQTEQYGFGNIGIGLGLTSGLMHILEAQEIVPGSPPSYQTAKDIYCFHPLGAKLAESPMRLAQSQEREITIPGAPEEDLVSAFKKEWELTGKVGADAIILQAHSLSRVYGISTLAVLCPKVPLDKELPLDKMHELDLHYNILDPINTAGSLVLNQDPLSPDFMKPQKVEIAGRLVHMSRVVVTLNGPPIWIEWTDSAFGFVGRSVYQRALYPLKSFIQSMITDNMIQEKAGIMVHKAKAPGSIIDGITEKFFKLKRSLIKGAKTGNVVQIGTDEDLTSMDLTNLQQAAEFSRNNILKNIAASADMMASMINMETLAEGFGEGSEDAKQIARLIDRTRIEARPFYIFFDDIVMRRAWSPQFYETIRSKYPDDYGKMPYETAFYKWKNAFTATWPNLLVEPDSEKAKVDDVIMKAAIACVEVLAPICDPENKARVAVWLADIMNERKLMFSSPLLLDEEGIASYEPPSPLKEPVNEPETYRDSQVVSLGPWRTRTDANLLEAHKSDSTGTALRKAIAAEIDAINLYEKMAEQISDETIRKVLLDVAKEEKTHIGEFEALLLKIDPEQVREMKRGREEVKK